MVILQNGSGRSLSLKTSVLFLINILNNPAWKTLKSGRRASFFLGSEEWLSGFNSRLDKGCGPRGSINSVKWLFISSSRFLGFFGCKRKRLVHNSESRRQSEEVSYIVDVIEQLLGKLVIDQKWGKRIASKCLSVVRPAFFPSISLPSLSNCLPSRSSRSSQGEVLSIRFFDLFRKETTNPN